MKVFFILLSVVILASAYKLKGAVDPLSHHVQARMALRPGCYYRLICDPPPPDFHPHDIPPLDGAPGKPRVTRDTELGNARFRRIPPPSPYPWCHNIVECNDERKPKIDEKPEDTSTQNHPKSQDEQAKQTDLEKTSQASGKPEDKSIKRQTEEELEGSRASAVAEAQSDGGYAKAYASARAISHQNKYCYYCKIIDKSN
ncbi:uncharacterized protein [Diabrotica undecimpunctata]|uniref:uncharacterized protein n=1 Tax=Diabrotica undecimpunctata TaxID=50387 RepID=UPI003B63990B